MTNDPWALHGSFYSVIVKRAAVIRSYPGGVEEFERREQPARKNGALFLLHFKSKQDAEFALLQLEDAGLKPGVDTVATDTTQGPLVDCPGLTFRRKGEGADASWWVNVEQKAPKARGPRRVIGSLVHYIYDDDDEEEDEAPRKLTLVPKPSGGTQHTIRIQYTDAILAAHGCMDHAAGEHQINVDAETVARIRSGEPEYLYGQGFHVEDEGMVCDRWIFNDEICKSVAFCLDRRDGSEPEWFDAIAMWIDGEEQPKPPAYYD